MAAVQGNLGAFALRKWLRCSCCRWPGNPPFPLSLAADFDVCSQGAPTPEHSRLSSLGLPAGCQPVLGQGRGPPSGPQGHVPFVDGVHLCRAAHASERGSPFLSAVGHPGSPGPPCRGSPFLARAACVGTGCVRKAGRAGTQSHRKVFQMLTSAGRALLPASRATVKTCRGGIAAVAPSATSPTHRGPCVQVRGCGGAATLGRSVTCPQLEGGGALSAHRHASSHTQITHFCWVCPEAPGLRAPEEAGPQGSLPCRENLLSPLSPTQMLTSACRAPRPAALGAARTCPADTAASALLDSVPASRRTSAWVSGGTGRGKARGTTAHHPDQHTPCTDIDECAATGSPCGHQGHCFNTEGSFHCQCARGYRTEGTAGTSCVGECRESKEPAGQGRVRPGASALLWT